MTMSPAACPDVGLWRAWLDQEHDSPVLNDHLPTCRGCQEVVANLRDDAAVVHDAVAVLAAASGPTPAQTALARERLEWRRRSPARRTPGLVPAQESKPMSLSRLSTPRRIAATAVAAALMLTVFVSVTPGAQAVAAGFLASFRSQSITPVEISPQSQADLLRTFNALGNLGTVSTPGGGTRPQAIVRGATEQARTVTLAEASTAVSNVLVPDARSLPAGFDPTPRVQVIPASQIKFTIDKAKAEAYMKSAGQPQVVVPDRFDGASLVVSIPAAAILQYDSAGSRDALIIGETGEIGIDTQPGKLGPVGLDELRSFITGLPGLPAEAAKLNSISNNTLPIPVPTGKVGWQYADIAAPKDGLLLNDNSGVGSAVIWHSGGNLYGAAGSLKASDLLDFAKRLSATRPQQH